MRPDEFSPDIYAAHWLFTVALGAGLGLCLAAVVLAVRRAALWKGAVLILFFGGLVLSALVGTLAVDAAPWQRIDVQLRPYLSTVTETGALVGALALGAVVVAAGALTLAWLAERMGRSILAAALGSVALAGVLLAVYLPVVDRAASGPKHPDGTDTRRVVASVPVLEGLDIPTGLDIAANHAAPIRATALTVVFSLIYFGAFTLVFVQALSGKPLLGKQVIVTQKTVENKENEQQK